MESSQPTQEKFHLASKKKPRIQRRLGYWLISDLLQEDVSKMDNVSAIRTDHAAVVLEIDSLADLPRGQSFWKFNSSLLEDSIYVQNMCDNYPIWLEEIGFFNDLRVNWDWIKYKIRQESIRYSTSKACERKAQIKKLRIH